MKRIGLVLMLLLTAFGTPVLAQDDSEPGFVVFASDRSGNYELYVLDLETGLTTQLTNDPADDIDPQLAADGEVIVFASDRDGDFELFVVNLDGTGLEQLTNNNKNDIQPRWQPNGADIVYVSDVNSLWDVYIITVETGVVRQLTNDAADERGPMAGAGGGLPGTAPTPSLSTPFPTVAAPAGDAVVGGTRLNVRANPGPGARIVGGLAPSTVVDIVGRYYDNSWVQIASPAGWVYAPLLTINIDLATVPVVNVAFIEAATATPVLPTPTPIPASSANLVAGVVVLEPSQPVCAQTFNVGFDVANLGTVPTSASGTVSLVDVRTADGSQQGTTIGGFPVLQPGQTFRVTMPLTISTWYEESHTITLIIDPGNQIGESVETDNTRAISYTLSKGACP